MSNFKASQRIKDYIKGFEGFSLKPYLDSVKVATIGWGSTMYPNGMRVSMKDPVITTERAQQIFDWHLSLFEHDVNSLIISNVSQNQFDALLSFAYNVGTDIDQDSIAEGLGDSTLLRKVNINPNDPSIEKEFLKWSKAGGQVLNGLLKRRQAEANIYFGRI
jgi:lysozyme